MGKEKASRSPEGDLLPGDVMGFWRSVSTAPGSIFADDNQENVQKNLVSTAKLLLRHPTSNRTNQALGSGIQIVCHATNDVQDLVVRFMQGDTFDGEAGDASVLLKSIGTVQAISDLIAAAEVCGAGIIVCNCLRWLHPTMMMVDRRGSNLGTRPGLRLCEGTNLAHTCMDLLKWKQDLMKVRDLPVLLFQTLGLMGLSKELARQVEEHPQSKYIYRTETPEAMMDPNQGLASLASDLYYHINRRTMLLIESLPCGDEDFGLLEELAGKAEEAKGQGLQVPISSAVQM
eukprot:gene1845-33264_t